MSTTEEQPATAAGTEEPATTEPATTEPATTEPATTEAAADGSTEEVAVTARFDAACVVNPAWTDETEYPSDCLPTDSACLAKEQKARDDAALAICTSQIGVYQPPPQGMAQTTEQGLTCTMDGFTKMISEMWEVVFAAVAVVKETALATVPENFQKAIQYAWQGAIGMGSWMGYVLAAVHFVADAPEIAGEGGEGFGADVCEALGYGYWLIDQLYVIVDFIPKDESNKSDIKNLSTQAEKDAAASVAMASANAAIAALMAAQEATVAATIAVGGDVAEALEELDNQPGQPQAASA